MEDDIRAQVSHTRRPIEKEYSYIPTFDQIQENLTNLNHAICARCEFTAPKSEIEYYLGICAECNEEIMLEKEKEIIKEKEMIKEKAIKEKEMIKEKAIKEKEMIKEKAIKEKEMIKEKAIKEKEM